jgi:hypothetical protein
VAISSASFASSIFGRTGGRSRFRTAIGDTEATAGFSYSSSRLPSASIR